MSFALVTIASAAEYGDIDRRARFQVEAFQLKRFRLPLSLATAETDSTTATDTDTPLT